MVTKNKRKGMNLKKPLMYFNYMTKNGKIYNRNSYNFQSLKQIAQNGNMLGELEHPNTMDISLSNVSHIINDIDIYRDHLIGDIKVLVGTAKGGILQDIIKDGINVDFSPRMTGTVDKFGNVKINQIYTFDAIMGDNQIYDKAIFRKNKILKIMKNIKNEN